MGGTFTCGTPDTGALTELVPKTPSSQNFVFALRGEIMNMPPPNINPYLTAIGVDYFDFSELGTDALTAYFA